MLASESRGDGAFFEGIENRVAVGVIVSLLAPIFQDILKQNERDGPKRTVV